MAGDFLASKPVMVLGNIASILLTIIGLLQYLSWIIVGGMIVAILSITTFVPTTIPGPKGEGHQLNKKPGSHPSQDTKPSREKTSDRQPLRPHQTPTRPETKPPTIRNEPPRASNARSEFQKSIAPKITPPKTIPSTVSPAKNSMPRPENLRPIPQIRPSNITIPIPPPPKIDPNVRVIERGDYQTYELQLEHGTEVSCEVAANATVNVYILNQENLTSLDLGEEFWSETGEEGTTKASLKFVAPESGKWFLVVENTDNREVSVTANIKRGQRSGLVTDSQR